MKTLNGDVNLGLKNLKRIPLIFNGIHVLGYFSIYVNPVHSLMNSPAIVDGDFDCENCNLTSLVGAPKYVGGHFDCRFNQLENLEGAPEEVGGDFICKGNPLVSLKGIPKEIGCNFIYKSFTRIPKFTEKDIRKFSNIRGQVLISR